MKVDCFVAGKPYNAGKVADLKSDSDAKQLVAIGLAELVEDTKKDDKK